MEENKDVGNFNCIIIRGADECSGSFQYRTDKADKFVGFYRMVQVSAFLICVAAWFFTGREEIGTLMKVDNKYILLGGVIGAFITVTVIQSMSSLGPAKAAMLIVIAQLAVAYLIELFGLFGVEKVDFQWKKLLGMAIAIVGIVIFKWEK